MKKKNTTRDNVNLFFSAFLIIAYIICGFFFVSFITQQSNVVLQNTLMSVVLLIFGLLVFYATRVGEGTTVMRFSLVTLIVLDLPALFIVLAYIIPAFPLHEMIAASDVMAYMAAAALGYGIPYTFISGFEAVAENAATDETEEAKLVEGGIEADVMEANEDTEPAEEPVYESDSEEIVVEGTAIIDDVEAYVSQQEEASEE
ncbi:MAG: hypothetical protein ACI4HO_01595 [Ruminococcus sp.]